ncbi:potassium channel family protein [Mesorhizobium sp. NBSH29]|uniref:potassium channel family protein n=1 Tax=Mesorhizobium sp. NBSH29 TaxID=2654249 RepID=UPI0021561F74|nr:potassium channel family protein [Mesorhizobium sp. NBSH29]
MITLTALIHTFGLIAITKMESVLQKHQHPIISMATTVLGLFLLLTVEVWLWALAHYHLGVIEHFETALYFSLTSFSTLGFGDVLPAREWRIFAALEGVNGFLLIGWSTAHLIAASIRVGPFRTGEHF